MSKVESVLALFEEANPVPDELTSSDEIELVPYLATLRRRSSEMTEMTPPETGHDPTRTRKWLVPAAAVIATALGVLIVILDQGHEEAPVVTEPTPTTIAEQVTTTPTTGEQRVTTTIAEQTLTTLPSLELDERLNGSWVTGTKVLTFDDGTYSLELRAGNSRDVVDEGTYTIPESNRVRLTSRGGMQCNNGDTTTLGYELEGDTLTMRGTTDDCLGRRNTLGREFTLTRD